MKSNEIVSENIFEIIRNQIKINDPPETKLTYDRLRMKGLNDIQTMKMIAQCLSIELFEMLKFKKPYNGERYVRNLKKLPEDPFDE